MLISASAEAQPCRFPVHAAVATYDSETTELLTGQVPERWHQAFSNSATRTFASAIRSSSQSAVQSDLTAAGVTQARI